jgi:hypothetical protein
MTGIGPEFLKLLRGIEWDTLTARDAVDLRAALKEAVGHSDEWFLKLTQDFGAIPGETRFKFGQAELIKPPTSPADKIESGRPQVEAGHPREPKPTVRAKVPGTPPGTKRKRGRPPKAKTPVIRPPALAIGGANAEGAERAPQAAKIFDNSYVSKEGPRADIPAVLPADHPRRLGGLNRESSVTPEVDMADFAEVEQAMRSGKGVKGVFQ